MATAITNLQSETRKRKQEQSQDLRVQRNINKVRQALSGIIENNEIDRWLVAPNPRLGGNRPLDEIRQDNTKQVMELLALVQEGIYV